MSNAKFYFLSLLFLSTGLCYGQSKLVVNGAYIKLNGGTLATPIYLVVEDSSSNGVIRNSGHIISGSEHHYLKRNFDLASGPFLFPFGYTTTDYIPFTVNKTTPAGARLAVSTWNTNIHNNPHPNGVTSMIGAGDSLTSAVDRFWRLTPDASLTADYTFSYRGAENTVTNPTTSTLVSQHWTVGNWQTPSTGGSLGVTSGVGNTTGSQALTAGSYPFVLTRAGFPLPVDFIVFNAIWANQEEKIAQLNWLVGEEYNVSHYIIKRSTDGVDYDSVGRVEADIQSQKEYQFLDKNATIEKVNLYYKIESVDFSGSKMETNFRLLTRSSLADLQINVFPNPFSSELQLQLSHLPKAKLEVKVYDNIGKLVYRKEESRKVQNISISLQELAAGSYNMVVNYHQLQFNYHLLKYN